MDYLLIVGLGIVIVSMWNSSRDAHERFRNAIERLQGEIEFLRSQVAALMRANVEGKAAAADASKAPEAAPATRKPEVSPQTAQAAHVVAPAAQEFTPPIAVGPAPATPMAQAQTPPQQAAGPVAQPPMPVPGATDSASQAPQPDAPKPQSREALPTLPVDPEKRPEPASTVRPAMPAAAAFQATPEQASARARLFSLEETLGANWLNKIGIASLVIGLAFFLAWKLQTWGPEGKVLCGFAVSIALLGGGVWLERKPTYRIFARGGIGGGWALAYFTTFAMYHLQAARVLDSLPFDLLLMLLVATGMVGHSLRYRSQAVTSLAFLLGFATLLTSHLEQPNQTVIFSLAASAILAVALVVVTTIRHWAVLELCGLIAVYVSHFVWLNEVLPANHAAFGEFWPSTALILLYWLIFRLAYVMRVPLDKREENLSSVSAILNSGGVLGLLKFQSAHPEWAFWALVVLGAFEMGLAYWAKPKRRQAFVVLSTIAVVLLVSSVPFRFHGVSWPVLWLVQAQVLAIAGLRLGEPVFRRLGLLVGVITGGVLALHDVMPLAIERMMAADPNRHWSLAAGLALAAILYWTHAEVYPRRWPEIEVNAMETLALKVSSWLALGAAATGLWVVIQDQWLPAGWIALFLALVVAGHFFAAPMPALEGDVLALGTAGALAFHHVLPLGFSRFEGGNPDRQTVMTVLLSVAALAYWVRGELFPRTLPRLSPVPNWDPAAWEAVMLPVASCIGTAAAASAMWVALPVQWVAVGWLAMVVVLGLAADWIASGALAVQADALVVAALAALAGWDLWHDDWVHHTPVLVAVALLYFAMRRKTAAGRGNYVPAAYSWAAAAVLLWVTFDIFASLWIAPVLTGLCVVLFEVGRFARKGFLRWQGYALLAMGFGWYLSSDLSFRLLGATPENERLFTLAGSHLLEVLILLAGGYWLLERTRISEGIGKAEHVVGLIADAIGTFCLMVWFGVRFPFYVHGGEGWIAAIWAGMATVLMALAWLMRRRMFVVQAIALAIAAVLRGVLFDLIGEPPGDFWHGPLYRLSVTAFVLLAALPFAFKMRGTQFWEGASLTPWGPLASALRHPVQWFFFAPFGMMVAVLAVKLSSGHITIAWSLLGLGTFLSALAVGERSFRLAGLILLLVSVAKILLMDVWKLSTPDKFTTLIILGIALIAVSFLYTRFGATIRKYL